MELLFLDSANPDDVQSAADSGIVAGVTTNPAIIQQGSPDADPIDHLVSLLDLFTRGPVFFQINAHDRPSAEALIERTLVQAGSNVDRLVLKLPAQPWWFSLGADLARAGQKVAFTAVYQPGQVMAAVQAGASYVIPYVDRAQRLRPLQTNLLGDLRAVAGDHLCVLAASIKTPEQAVSALTSGAHAITASWAVLHELMVDDLTDAAIDQFHSQVPESKIPATTSTENL
ncbi:transaldolase family protein [Arthrobacter sp. H20]|uniref:transaldolase family protein n=1 Tax=Arthrobacter sp. H20 TaxID=1267981 RepID=UPI000478B03C|nr:transaldolase family protein [Arthrobacter sp. H20]